MKTFIVTVCTPRPRSVHTSKAVVSAQSVEAALILAQTYYGPDKVGWPKGTSFKAEELNPNEVRFIA